MELVGHVAETDALLAGASILLAPAPREPFGLSVVEAMAHGLPVVAAGGGAHLETVGDDGLLFPRGDTGGSGSGALGDSAGTRPSGAPWGRRSGAGSRSGSPCPGTSTASSSSTGRS